MPKKIEKKMKKLIEGDTYMTISAQAPSPSKDFINLTVTKNEVIWRHWKIGPQCLKPDVRVTPVDHKESHADFLVDKNLQDEIRRVFNKNCLAYVKSLCGGTIDFLQRLDKTLQIYILSFLELEDIGSIAQTNKYFYDLCQTEELWEHFVESHSETLSPEVRVLAKDIGWKTVFFINKVELQRQIKKNREKKAKEQ